MRWNTDYTFVEGHKIECFVFKAVNYDAWTCFYLIPHKMPWYIDSKLSKGSMLYNYFLLLKAPISFSFTFYGSLSLAQITAQMKGGQLIIYSTMLFKWLLLLVSELAHSSSHGIWWITPSNFSLLVPWRWNSKRKSSVATDWVVTCKVILLQGLLI